MPLLNYRKKRKFNSTSEPRGEVVKKRGALVFVVQKHWASHLHYDFRLQMQGVLKSWAVPKGLPQKSKDKRLAIMVEDHPLAYAKFKGKIPKGSYGAGKVIIWDRGTYKPYGINGGNSELSLLAGLRKGHITFVIYGKKLRGEYSLVKLKKADDKSWLLIKAAKKFVEVKDELPVSSAEGRNNKKNISRGRDAVPRHIKPMLATLVDKPFDDPKWLFEVKWDGYRALSETGGNIKLYSRNQNDFSKKYPEITEGLKHIRQSAVLDGEIVVLNRQGKPDFQALQDYSRNKRGFLRYCVFDLLFLDGRDLRKTPLITRKNLLRQIIPKKSIIQLSDYFKNRGKSFFSRAKKLGLEGIVAKRAESFYHSGLRSRDWLKIKTKHRQEAIIAGFTEPRGSRKYFGSLALAVWAGNKLKYAGHVGTGFSGQSLKSIFGKLQKLKKGACPFDHQPKIKTPTIWVKPHLICEVEFSQWTQDGLMRHPSFLGLREDKYPKQVTMEMPILINPGKH